VVRTEGATVPHRRVVHGRWSSPVLTSDGGGGQAGRGGAREVLTGDGRVAKRRRTGVSSPFYRGGRGGGVTAALMALTTLKMGARLRRGLRGGSDGGRVTAQAASRGVELVAQGVAGGSGGMAELGRSRR
jgi:hypothetical protein